MLLLQVKMVTVLILFAIGILIGRLLQNKEQIKRPLSTVSLIAILALLFYLGLSISSNPDILARIKEIGIVSLSIAVASVAGSITFVTLLVKIRK